MDFDFTEAEGKVCQELPGLLDSEVMKQLARLEGGESETADNTLRHCLRILGEAGYLRLDAGVELIRAQEALAAISPSLFLCAEVSARLLGRLLRAYGTGEQQAEILPGIDKGESLGAVAFTEGSTSIENNPFHTEGTPAEDDCRVSGSKSRVLNGPIADWIAVAGSLRGQKAFFLLRGTHPGIEPGDRVPIMGYGGLPVSDLRFAGCRIPLSNVVGPFEDEAPLRTLRMWEDQVLIAAALGLMKRSYESALLHAKEHRSGGMPIIGYQEVGFKLAEMLTLHQTGQLLAYHAAWTATSGGRDAAALTHCAKVFCGEAAEKIASQALQVLGGAGVSGRNSAATSYREAKYVQVAGTSTEISRMKIADRVLELY